MIGVDTNVLVRFFLGDDEEQSRMARDVIAASSAERPIFVGVLVLAEFVWVLQKFYDVPRNSIFEALNVLIAATHIVIERQELVAATIELASQGKIDLADALIAAIASDAGCDCVVTFDKTAAMHIPGMELLS